MAGNEKRFKEAAALYGKPASFAYLVRQVREQNPRWTDIRVQAEAKARWEQSRIQTR